MTKKLEWEIFIELQFTRNSIIEGSLSIEKLKGIEKPLESVANDRTKFVASTPGSDGLERPESLEWSRFARAFADFSFSRHF